MNSREGNIFKNYLELSKIKIMVPVGLTGFTGYFIYKPEFTSGLILITAGILFLAISASVLNQVQETQIDSLMERTRNRPIPSGKISRRKALAYFVVSFIAGTSLVIATGSIKALLI